MAGDFFESGYKPGEVRALVLPMVDLPVDANVDIVIVVGDHETQTMRIVSLLSGLEEEVTAGNPCKLLIIEQLLLGAVNSNANALHAVIHGFIPPGKVDSERGE